MLQNRLKAVSNALCTIQGAKVYHYNKPASEKAPYIVWAEDNGGAFGADNRNEETSIEGTIDVYSKKEFDSLFDAVPEALRGVACCRINNVEREDETKLIHYEYVFWC
jgi:hypothetical protein